jgi:hypothetical protein
MNLITTSQFQMHGFMLHFQHHLWSSLYLLTSLHGPITRPCNHAHENCYFWHLNGSVWK